MIMMRALAEFDRRRGRIQVDKSGALNGDCIILLFAGNGVLDEHVAKERSKDWKMREVRDEN
jgi:hypothetical protein